jgi:toxin YhaV
MLVVKGWKIGAHPRFVAQLARLIEAVEREKARKPDGYHDAPNAKLLAAILSLILVRIPEDPNATAYRLGDTLGNRRTHWFRAKFGGGRFRLFFRFSSGAGMILFVWVNDEKTLRTYESRTHAYGTFARMLDSGNAPEDWSALQAAAIRPEDLRQIIDRAKVT